MHAWQHFCTITRHKLLVMKGCFQIGLYKQGLLHDLSKYGPTEFMVGAKYYMGTQSPNNAERMDRGYSSAWLHHKGRNKHHLEYWIDYDIPAKGEDGRYHTTMTGMKMPVNYVCEGFIDRISASKNYQKEKYTDASALIYYTNSKEHYIIHEDTAALLEYMLEMLAVRGERKTFSYVKRVVLKGKLPYEKEALNRMTEQMKKKYAHK